MFEKGKPKEHSNCINHTLAGSRAGEEAEFELAPGVKIVMCWIPPGDFLMGTPDRYPWQRYSETQHQVSITQGFWLAKTQTTQEQWLGVMGYNPSYFKGINLPVEQVDWIDICGDESRSGGFLGKANANKHDIWKFDLPTEAQWEYACRAGLNACNPDNFYEIAWHLKNSDMTTHPVGQKKPNEWGIYDMFGNVREWCIDWYLDYDLGINIDPVGPLEGRDRVLRGGAFFEDAKFYSVAHRHGGFPRIDIGGSGVGFRLARNLIATKSDIEDNLTRHPDKDKSPIFCSNLDKSYTTLSEASSRSILELKTHLAMTTPARRAGAEQEFEITPGVYIIMCWIPPGEFLMGSPENEEGRKDNETQHRVTITQGFWLAKTQTTQDQWQSVMGFNPCVLFKGPDTPVDCVSWNDICGDETGRRGFFGMVNANIRDDWRFDLPTEAQWEYACRAGTTGPYAGNLNDMAWYDGSTKRGMQPVGLKKPNAWGLHDMHGNVIELCSDWFGPYETGNAIDYTGPTTGQGRVGRGGSWGHIAYHCRSGNRNGLYPPSSSQLGVGFRIACVSTSLVPVPAP